LTAIKHGASTLNTAKAARSTLKKQALHATRADGHF